MGLQSFEHGVERMVEGVFSRSGKSSIRPIELGRRLVREMDDHRSVDVKGRRIVPNQFQFHISPRDHAGFAEIEAAFAARPVGHWLPAMAAIGVLAPAATLVVWTFLDLIRSGKPTAVGAATAMTAELTGTLGCQRFGHSGVSDRAFGCHQSSRNSWPGSKAYASCSLGASMAWRR